MKNRVLLTISLIAFSLSVFYACNSAKKNEEPLAIEEVSMGGSSSSNNLGLAKLSEYGFFEESLAALKPKEGVIEYSLNTPLFSDYAYKARFVKIPKGQKVQYNPTETMDFPTETILIKNFYYPEDFNQLKGKKRILETRLLIKEASDWKALVYIWNDEQTDAFLEVAGKNIEVKWKHTDGQLRQVNYSVPNLNQCKSCHDRSEKLVPIGPTARQLNGPLNQDHDLPNQLTDWQSLGLLEGLPDLKEVSKLAVWDHPESGTLNERARAWIEINCAHCHRTDGPAKTSGLHLLASESDPFHLGLGKPPIAAGKGSGGLKYDIVPGKPEESIFYFRINSTHPGIMMPELGRKLVHDEGVALVKQWIEQL